MFIIFINDIQKDLESEILLFADDTTLLAVGKDPAETTSILNRDLSKIESWAKTWKVTFSAKKTKSMIFSKKLLCNSPALMFCNKYIDRVVTHKHLGIILSSTLDWTPHINYICLKASRKLNVLRSVRYLDRKTLDILYKVTVRSTFDYGLHIFYHTLTQSNKKRLDQLQYKAAKLVGNALHYTNQLILEKDIGWESIKSRAEVLGLSVYHKLHFNKTRRLIQQCMTSPDNNLYNLRNNGNKRLRHPYLGQKFENSFFPYFTNLWNNLPQKMRCYDFDLFKEQLHIKYKPPKIKFYSHGTKIGNGLLTRLRVDRSFLNAHAYSIGLAISPQCACGAKQETTLHTINFCPLYDSGRRILFDYVGQLVSPFKAFSHRQKMFTLLYGYKSENKDYYYINIQVTLAVQNFLIKTKHFVY